MLVLIDNYDSFTYNLVHYFEEIGQKVKVFRNDEVKTKDIFDINPNYIVISLDQVPQKIQEFVLI